MSVQELLQSPSFLVHAQQRISAVKTLRRGVGLSNHSIETSVGFTTAWTTTVFFLRRDQFQQR